MEPDLEQKPNVGEGAEVPLINNNEDEPDQYYLIREGWSIFAVTRVVNRLYKCGCSLFIVYMIILLSVLLSPLVSSQADN
jgi:hypothetical protein